MKFQLALILSTLMAAPSFGQISSYLSNLKTSESGINVAEISLIQKSRSDDKNVNELGSLLVMIPRELNRVSLKVEYYRFRSIPGTPFKMDGKTFIPVDLYYDSETNDPRDDIFVLSVPFEVDEGLVISELSHYQGISVISAHFQEAPNGESTVSIEQIEILKKE